MRRFVSQHLFGPLCRRFSSGAFRKIRKYSTFDESSSEVAPEFSEEAPKPLATKPRVIRRTRSAAPQASQVFVSEYHQIPRNEILRFLQSRQLTYKENLTHYVIQSCPFCHPIKNQTDMHKLYIAKQNGLFKCHRCNAKGSWFDFRKRLAGEDDLTVGARAVVLPSPNSSPSSERESKVGKWLENEGGLDQLQKNLDLFPEAMKYLTETRGLTLDVIRKYCIGATVYPILNDRNVEEQHVCITFPWIHLSPAPKKVKSRAKTRKPAPAIPLIEQAWAPESDEKGKADEKVRAEEEAAGLGDTADDSLPQRLVDRVKFRPIKYKTFRVLQGAGAESGWFGWHTVPSDAQVVVITEGEFDAMAVHQATGLPAISLPNGASQLPPHLLPSLERFKKILLWMDDDIVGQNGALTFANKLGSGRCYIVRSRGGRVNGPKDANEALLQKADFFNILGQAEVLPHNQIATFAELRNDLYRELNQPGHLRGVAYQSLRGLNELLKGHRRGELTILSGPTGVGKTTLLSQLSLDLCQQGVNTLWGSFEIKLARLAKTLLFQYASKNFEDPETFQEFDHWADKFSELQLYFLRHFGSSDIHQIIDAMDYAVYAHDIQHVVLDNLQFMLSGQSRGYDKFDKQEQAVELLREFATCKNVHVTLVIHPRKEPDGTQLSLSSIFGSAKATQEADNVLMIQDGRLCRQVRVLKNRFDGSTGVVNLRFDPAIKRFIELTRSELEKLESKL